MPENPASNELEKLKKTRESYRQRTFWFMIEVAFIFGIPAIMAFLLGNWLDDVFETGKKIVISFLIVTFISSWITVIRKYLRIMSRIRAVNQKIHEELEYRGEEEWERTHH